VGGAAQAVVGSKAAMRVDRGRKAKSDADFAQISGAEILRPVGAAPERNLGGGIWGAGF